MHKKEDIISFDFQGWPNYKMNLREIIERLGFKLEGGKWVMEDNDPKLNIYPRRLTDDGMGYGVHEEYFIEAAISEQDDYCNLFTEAKIENIELWLENKIQPFTEVCIKNPNNELNGVYGFLRQIKKEENGEIKFLFREMFDGPETDKKPRTCWVTKDEIDDSF